MSKKRLAFRTGVSCTVALGALILGTVTAGAANADPVRVASVQPEPETTIVYVPYSEPQKLVDAVKVTEALGEPVLAYRFENDEVVGEYNPGTGLSVNEYLADFESSYGTQPEVVSVAVEVPLETAESLHQQDSYRSLSDSAAAPSLDAPGPAFDAAPASSTAIDRLLANHRESVNEPPTAAKTSSAEFSTLAASRWDPTQADIQITRPNSSIVYFSQYYYWDGTVASTKKMHPDDGMEFEINIYSARSELSVGTRPVCNTSSYKDIPFAKNKNWTWAALVNTGSGMKTLASAAGAYADYNDLSDPCNRNSMAIGIRTPQNIPAASGGRQEIMLTIQAPRGIENSGRIGGTVQPVNETGCFLNPAWSSTDCMGLTKSSLTARGTLSESRNWTAPNRCWRSLNYGTTAPTQYTC